MEIALFGVDVREEPLETESQSVGFAADQIRGLL